MTSTVVFQQPIVLYDYSNENYTYLNFANLHIILAIFINRNSFLAITYIYIYILIYMIIIIILLGLYFYIEN